MKIIEYFSNYAILIFILIIIIYGMKDKKNIFELFTQGALDGEKIVFKLFPTFLGLMFATSLITASGILDFINNFLKPIINFLNIESQLVPLILLRPVSGSASMAIATDLMKNYGVDSKVGIISSLIMGTTETTIFVVSLYASSVKIKDVKEVIIIGIIADIISIFCSILAYNVGLIS